MRRKKFWKPGDELTEDDKKLLQIVWELYSILGRTPKKSECTKSYLLKVRFRTWNNVILACGLPSLNTKEEMEKRKMIQGRLESNYENG